MHAPDTSPTINGYDIEPDLVYADAGPQPDWLALYPLADCHPTRPTDTELSDCVDGSTHDDTENSGCYACMWEVCEEGSSPLTPRLAFVLHTSAVVLADNLRTGMSFEIVETPDLADRLDLSNTWFWSHMLPRAAHRQMTYGWAHRFIACFETIAGRLAAGRGLSANCTGEEAAMHALLSFASDLDRDGDIAAVWGDELAALPDAGTDDADFAYLRDVCLEDRDVLWLYDEAFDGVESDEQAAADLRTVNLRPSEWFLPFRDVATAA